jgi:streptogramin lyase
MRSIRLCVLCIQLLLALACSSECKDEDGDGRGEDCEAGPDCDDSDRARGASCAVDAAVCEADPYAKGCPCYAGTTQKCFSGPEPTIDVGPCQMGRQSCPQGTWTSCIGEIGPAAEACNAVDDDCDGITDEGAQSPCGGCNSSCVGGVWGPPAAPFNVDAELDAELAVTEFGELTLPFIASESVVVWVPNTAEGTLSKIDARSATEVARYRVAGDTPERVAVDHHGDAWVLSPSLDGESQLTKVAAGEDRCRVRGPGALQTSAAAADVLAFGEDDCVLFGRAVGGAGEMARSLSIDGTRAPDRDLGGNAWVGMQNGQRLIVLDGDSAEPVLELPLPGVAPLDSVFDPWGVLWLVDRAGLLVRVDPAFDPPTVEVLEAPLRCYEFDSVASDLAGVLTLTGFACEDVVTYDSRRKLWRQIRTEGVLDTRGVTVLGEHSWVVHTAGRLSRVVRQPLAIDATFEIASDGVMPLESMAVGADSLGRLWVVSSSSAGGGPGVLSRFDPERELVDAQLVVGELPRPHGDITGNRRLGEFAKVGRAQHVFEGCAGSTTTWEALHIEWSGGASASTSIEARRAQSRELLDSAAFVSIGRLPEQQPPYPLDFEQGGVVQVRVTLRADARLGAPRIGRVGVQWRCLAPD